MAGSPSANELAGQDEQVAIRMLDERQGLHLHPNSIASSFLLSFTVLVIFLSTIYLLTKKKFSRCLRRLPPGPQSLPIIGNLHQLGALPHRSLRRLAATYGPLMHLQLGQIPTLIVSSPAHARDVLKTHDLAFCSRPRLTTWQKYSYGGIDLAFAPYSPRWIRARKIAAVEFFSSKKVQLLRPSREEEVRTLTRTIALAARRSAGGCAAVNLSEMFMCLLSNVTCQAVFGKRYAPEGECVRSVFAEMVSQAVELMGGFVAGDFFPCAEHWLNVVTGVQRRLEQNFREMDELLEREVSDKESGGGGSDFASVLVRIEKDASSGLTRDEIKAILLVLFIAAVDTTAAVLVWAMAELMRNPTALSKAREEVREVAGDKHHVEESDLRQLTYLKLVVRETLRLHSPGPLLLPRVSREDCQIGGYDIPAGTRVYINAWAIGRDPGTWDRPDEFCPERFLNNSVDYRGQHFEFVPFGGGRRLCPGLGMAEAIVELTLATLLHGFDWAPPQGMDDIDVSESFGIVVKKKVPLVLVATPTQRVSH